MLRVYFDDGRVIECERYTTYKLATWHDPFVRVVNYFAANDCTVSYVIVAWWCRDVQPLGKVMTSKQTPPPEWVVVHANLKRVVFELRRVWVDGDGALEARVVACLGIVL